MRISAHYIVFDHLKNEPLLNDADIKTVVKTIGIPYDKVSLYAANGYKYNHRYSIEKSDEVMDLLMDELYTTLMELRNSVGKDRFKRLKFTKREKAYMATR